MQGGYKTLVHPPTKAQDIDVEGTREERNRMRAALQEREEMIERLRTTAV